METAVDSAQNDNGTGVIFALRQIEVGDRGGSVSQFSEPRVKLNLKKIQVPVINPLAP